MQGKETASGAAKVRLGPARVNRVFCPLVLVLLIVLVIGIAPQLPITSAIPSMSTMLQNTNGAMRTLGIPFSY